MASTIALGLFGLNEGLLPTTAMRVAQMAETGGFDSLWMGEHVVLPDPQTPDSPMGPEEPILDPLITLAYLAAGTQSIRLGTGIIILPQRQPLVLGKELASLDVLSGGRLILGVGVGYLAPEFAALGAPLTDRGARADDYLDAMQAIWREGPVSHQGPLVQFAGVKARPLPFQRPSPPLVVGGSSTPAYRRSVSRAHGWYGYGLDLAETARALADLAHVARNTTRPPELTKLEISVTPTEAVDRQVMKHYMALGVDRLILRPPQLTDMDALAQWVKEMSALAMDVSG